MGYWYWRSLKDAWVLNENTTNKFDLPEKGMLSGLLIHSQAVNAAALAEYDNKYPIQRHTLLRILGNGSNEIISAKAKQLQAMCMWDWKINPKGNYTDVNGLYQRNYFYIPFGRYLGDPEYGLDLGKFAAGTEFEETNNYSTTYHTDGSQVLDVMGLFRKNPEAGLFSKGYLSKRQIKDKDAASENKVAVKLPTENRLKQIALFTEADLSSHVDQVAPEAVAQYIYLSVKSREDYLLNKIRTRYYANWIHDVMGRVFETNVQASVGTTTAGLGYADTMLYRGFNVTSTPVSDTLQDTGLAAKFDDRRIHQIWFHQGGSAWTVGVANICKKGIMPHGLVPLLHQDPLSEESLWLDAKALGDVYVEVDEGNSTGNWYIVLDELIKNYPPS